MSFTLVLWYVSSTILKDQLVLKLQQCIQKMGQPCRKQPLCQIITADWEEQELQLVHSWHWL